jgi:hypothetical protein
MMFALEMELNNFFALLLDCNVSDVSGDSCDIDRRIQQCVLDILCCNRFETFFYQVELIRQTFSLQDHQ